MWDNLQKQRIEGINAIDSSLEVVKDLGHHPLHQFVYQVRKEGNLYVLKGAKRPEERKVIYEAAALKGTEDLKGVCDLIENYENVDINGTEYYMILKEFIGGGLFYPGADGHLVPAFREMIEEIHARGISGLDLKGRRHLKVDGQRIRIFDLDDVAFKENDFPLFEWQRWGDLKGLDRLS